MKSRQLLSIVFALIMFTGVTMGNAVYAQSDSVEVNVNTVDDTTEEEHDDEREEHDERKHHNLDDRLEAFCEMAEDEKEAFFADHPRIAEFADRLAEFCLIESEDEREDAIENFVEEFLPEIKEHDYHMDYKKDMRKHLEKYCEMTDEEKKAFVEEHDKAEDHVDKMNKYCTLDEDGRIDFIEEHKDEYKAHMKKQMHDKYDHLDYERLCSLSSDELALEITDASKLDRISNWCEMTPEEREDYKREHHDNKMHDFDGMSDKAKHHMSDVAKAKLSENSERLKSMIMDKRDISDERRDEIRMKYEEKHGDLDERKLKLKMKFENHMSTMKIKMSDERKSLIHDRVSEMKAFKAELRERASDMTDEEKQQLREEFIDKAKEIQLAWISPRTQTTAGVDPTEVECREGFNLVMKASNGVPMCLKSDTALTMIDRGIVVPAN